ncbi:hypothetical protein IFM89_018602 [Coptis chinensis]|uniref:cellulase n=1 Tax=Coptis chinensis TaxID=261450 RepID=A0A835LW71_9MAGN|nr:hypothetical protein IFM89_018602 [Coptis chinensis]
MLITSVGAPRGHGHSSSVSTLFSESHLQYRGAYSDSLGSNCTRFYYSYSIQGYGPDFPRRIHHRGSSLPSLISHPQTIGYDGGFHPFFYSSNPNPNILIGAVVGGPDQNNKSV